MMSHCPGMWTPMPLLQLLLLTPIIVKLPDSNNRQRYVILERYALSYHRAEPLSDDACRTPDVAYIGPKSRTEPVGGRPAC